MNAQANQVSGVPVKVQLHDPDAVRPVIEAWLRRHVGDDVEVHGVKTPSAAGVANETLLVDASRNLGGERREHGYVFRVGVSEHLFMGTDTEVHYRIYETLARKPQIPSPGVVGFEPDPSLLGHAFFVMDRVAGLVPPDHPHFYAGGWLLDLTPQEQGEVWRGFVEVMAKLHQLSAADFPFLERPHLGRTGIEQELNHWLAYAKWCGGDANPLVQRASAWLVEHLPQDAPPGFSWGDARLPNIIYDGTRVAAVLDWDMVSLAGAEADLAWWAHMDHSATKMKGMQRPAGMGSRRKVIELWQELMGRPAMNLDWHLVFSALRIKLVWTRLPRMLLATGQVTPEQAKHMSEHDNMEWLHGLLDGPPGRGAETRWLGWDD
jgi:aminoglycoside phosphotransferase (APT) family kinase protein